MSRMIAPGDEEPQASYLGLIGLLLGLALGAVVLDAAGGPPHLPAHLPSWALIGATLRGSYLPLGILAYILSMAAWVVWLWIVGSLVLRLGVLAMETVTHGAAWVQALRAASDHLTLPVVRRVVDGALVTVFVVNVVSRTIPGAAAAPLPTPVAPRITAVRSHGASPLAPASNHRPRDITYTVQPGDTLWGIAQRFYGTGEEFPRLVSANVGRSMTDGERFTAAGVIQPGWVLDIPLPSQTVIEANGARYYVVEPGDTLQGIAAGLLGNEDRWQTLFAINRGTAELNGHALTDPDVIWPGLRLKLPLAPAHAAPAHPSTPTSRTTSPHGHVARKPPRRRLSPTPVEATPAPIAVRPTPQPTVAVPTASTSTYPAIAFPGGETDIIAGAAGAAAVAAGGALLLGRRRVRRSLNEPPIPAPPRPQPLNEFAEADPARGLAHRLQSNETEPMTGLVTHVCRILVEHGIDGASVLWVQQGRNTLTIVLRVPSQDQEPALNLAAEVGRRLGGKGRASVNRDHDVTIHLSGLSLVGLTLYRPVTGTIGPCLVSLGVSHDGQTLYGNWDEFGHILLTGMPGGGTDVVLTSLVSTLAARCRPENLHLSIIADRRTLPPGLVGLPHRAGDVVDPHDGATVRQTLDLFRSELIRRMRCAEREGGEERPAETGEPEMVLVVGELGDLPDDGTTLEVIGRQGPRFGIRLVAATTRADAVGDDVLSHFETRLVLQTFGDDESIRLIGQPEAADLGDGEFYLRIAGRTPIRLRGFRVSPDHLDELVRLMRETYGDAPLAVPSAVQRDGQDADLRADAGEERVLDAEQVSPNERADPAERADVVSPEDGKDGRLPPEDVPEIVVRSGTEASRPTNGNGSGHGLEAGEARGLPGVPVMETTVASNGHRVNVDTVMTEEPTLPCNNVGEEQPDRPLIEVRCFGEFVVRSGDREISPSGEEGVSFKALEVLAFLAAHPGGAVDKEKILAAVWPDAGAESAAGRLRTALKRLRALLAEQVPNLSSEVVRSERDGTRRLDTTLITSDVHRFMELLRAAAKLPPGEAKLALQEARALYQGDLLSGRGARLCEWVEERDLSGVSLREHYREEYYRATERLARLHYRDGHAELAVPLYKELLKAEPTVEDVVRELYRCYQQLGDLHSLIREDRHLRQAFRDAYADFDDSEVDTADIEPEPETVALFKEIRGELEVSRVRTVDT